MALSNSFDFTLTRDEVITEALENIGAKDMYTTTADTEVVTSVVRTFQVLLKSLIAKGLYIWTWREASLPLVADTLSYTLGPSTGTATDVLTSALIENPQEIADVRLVDTSNNERPCNLISVSEYKQYPNKTTEGEITNVAFQKGLTTSTLFVWPVNTDTTDVLKFQYKRQLDDVDSSTNSLCAPAAFMKAIITQLTVDIAPKFYIPLADRQDWERKAEKAWSEVDDFEEGTSFNIQPRFR